MGWRPFCTRDQGGSTPLTSSEASNRKGPTCNGGSNPSPGTLGRVGVTGKRNRVEICDRNQMLSHSDASKCPVRLRWLGYRPFKSVKWDRRPHGTLPEYPSGDDVSLGFGVSCQGLARSSDLLTSVDLDDSGSWSFDVGDLPRRTVSAERQTPLEAQVTFASVV